MSIVQRRALMWVAAHLLCGWSVEDSLGIRYLERVAAGDGALRHIAPSPDGKHFFFLTSRGDLACDCVVYELPVFSVEGVRAALRTQTAGETAVARPLWTITKRSASSDADYGRGIADAVWKDATTILFYGVEGQGKRLIYRLNVATGKSHALSREDHNAMRYDYAGGSLVYETFLPRESVEDPLDTYPAVTIVGRELDPRLTGFVGNVKTVYFGSHHGAPLRPLITLRNLTVGNGPWVSPNGKYAVLMAASDRETIPSEWAQYDLGIKNPSERFLLIDLSTGDVRPMIDAPNGWVTRDGRELQTKALWSSDSRRVLLFNTAVPLADDPDEHRRSTYMVDYDVVSATWAVVGAIRPVGRVPKNAMHWTVTNIDWTAKDKCVGIEYAAILPTYVTKALGRVIYERRAKGWERRPEGHESKRAAARVPELDGGLKVLLHEDRNHPPMLSAFDGKQGIALMPADPALSALNPIMMEEVTWTDPDGKTEKGGVLLPYRDAKDPPPPLVIQAYAYEPDKFTPDGPFSTAYAGQALASRGMAVLFMDIPNRDRRAEVGSTAEEGPYFVSRIDAAVHALSNQNVANSKHVGLVGFSRGAYSTYYAITHPGRTTLAAAVAADGWTASYGEYVTFAALGDDSSIEFEQIQGGRGGSFWQNREAWLEHAPGFNVYQSKTPVLFTVANLPTNTVGMLETLGAFRLAKRPFEFIAFPKGSHELQRPRERLASMTATVDWMAFWLQAYEDPADDKKEKYARWRQTRTNWALVKAAEEESRAGSQTNRQAIR